MNVNDYNDPIAEAADEINRLRDQLEIKDQILKSVAQQGIEQQQLITELAEWCSHDPESITEHGRALLQRAREAAR